MVGSATLTYLKEAVDPSSGLKMVSGSCALDFRFILKFMQPNDTLKGDNASPSLVVTHSVQGANGISLTGCHTVGFILSYELLCGNLDTKILPGDKPHELGAILVRLLSPGDVLSKSYMASVLRVLASNSKVANDMPNFRSVQNVSYLIMLTTPDDITLPHCST